MLAIYVIPLLLQKMEPIPVKASVFLFFVYLNYFRDCIIKTDHDYSAMLIRPQDCHVLSVRIKRHVQ